MITDLLYVLIKINLFLNNFFSFFFFKVCAYNRTVSKVKDFLNNEAKNTKIIGAFSIEEMVR